MAIPEHRVEELVPAWKTVLDIAQATPKGSWLLVGGHMIQVHAGLHGYRSRATEDVDVLIDIMANASNVSKITSSLRTMGFEFEEPILRGSVFHRMYKRCTSVRDDGKLLTSHRGLLAVESLLIAEGFPSIS